MTNDTNNRAGDAVWFITGCSTGFGRELAIAALERGKRVVVTARNPETLGDIVAGREAHALVLGLDVTHENDVRQAVTYLF